MLPCSWAERFNYRFSLHTHTHTLCCKSWPASDRDIQELDYTEKNIPFKWIYLVAALRTHMHITQSRHGRRWGSAHTQPDELFLFQLMFTKSKQFIRTPLIHGDVEENNWDEEGTGLDCLALAASDIHALRGSWRCPLRIAITGDCIQKYSRNIDSIHNSNCAYKSTKRLLNS